MPLYRSRFSRYNFSVNPPLEQHSDVLLRTDIPFDDAHMVEFESALWSAVGEQNPHWAHSAGPAGATSGWSSVLGGHKVELMPEGATLALAWHISQDGWLKADGQTMTVDPDEAGRFTTDQLIELQARYPGERYPMVSSQLVSHIYGEDGKPRRDCKLQLHFDEFVFWGYGERTTDSYVEVSKALVTGLLNWPFKLPEPNSRGTPQEYERRASWAWRFIWNGMGVGETWHAAESKAEALDAAREVAVREMRSSGHRHTSQFLATKYDVDVFVGQQPSPTEISSTAPSPADSPAP